MHHQDPSGQPEGGSGFAVGDLLRIARRRWLLIASVVFSITGIAAAVLYSIPNRYEASATVQIDPRKRTIVQIENVTSDLRTETPIVESEVEILKSRAVIGRVIDDLGLRQDPEFNEPGMLASVLSKLGLTTWAQQSAKKAPGERVSRDPIADLLASEGSMRLDPLRDSVASAFISKLRVLRVRNSLLIDIRFVSKDAVKAARIVNAIADAYLKDQIENKVRATTGATDLLEQKLDGLRQQLYDSERKVAQFKTDNNIIDSEGQLLSEKQLARSMEELVRARNASAEAQAKYEQVKTLLKHQSDLSGVGDVLASPTIRMLKEQHSRLTRQQAELLTRYGQKHPTMQKVNAEARDIQQKIDQEASQIVVNLRTELDVATDRERQLTASLEGLKVKQGDVRDAAVKLRELEREAMSSKQVFEALLARYKQTAETQSIQVADARIIEMADVPLYPISPKRRQMLMAATALALAAGFGLAFLLEFMAPGLRRPEDVERTLSAAHIGSIPQLEINAATTIAAGARIAIAQPRSLFAEAIGSARHEIDQQWQSAGPRVILVASTLPGEGTTLIASNLAHHYAVSGARTLLIDADLRMSKLTHQLGLTGRPGLREVLAGYMTPEAAVLRDSTTGLSVMPATSGAPQRTSAPEALASASLGQIFAILKGRYDVIIVDAPPLLPVVDGRIVADHADQIVMTMSWRKTPTDLAKRAIKLLGYNAERVAGVIVNQVDPQEIQNALGYTEVAPMPERRRRRAA
jgi:polysaccharide biosynthesis transport protein